MSEEREPPTSKVILTPEEQGVILIPGEPPVPASVSPRQASLALLAAGLLDTVESAVAAAPKAVQIDWQRATEIRRDNPTLAAVSAQLGLTDAQVNDLFRAAAQFA